MNHYTANHMQEYWSYLFTLLGRAECGLLTPHARMASFLDDRISYGLQVLQRWPQLRPDSPHHLERVCRIAGQGALIGSELCFQTRAEHAVTRRLSDNCALANLMVSAFDQVVDERPAGAVELLATMSRGKVAEALRLSRPEGEAVFQSTGFTDPASNYVTQVAELLFLDCRRLGNWKNDARLWESFATTVLGAYDAELATSRVIGGSRASLADAYRLKSALVGAMLGGIVMFSPSSKPGLTPGRVADLMSKVGEAAGLTDDLCDLFDDMEAGRLSCLLLMAGVERKDDGGIAETVRAMVREGVIERAVSRLVAIQKELAASAKGAFTNPERFMGCVRLWLSSWFAQPLANAGILPPKAS